MPYPPRRTRSLMQDDESEGNALDLDEIANLRAKQTRTPRCYNPNSDYQGSVKVSSSPIPRPGPRSGTSVNPSCNRSTSPYRGSTNNASPYDRDSRTTRQLPRKTRSMDDTGPWSCSRRGARGSYNPHQGSSHMHARTTTTSPHRSSSCGCHAQDDESARFSDNMDGSGFLMSVVASRSRDGPPASQPGASYADNKDYYNKSRNCDLEKGAGASCVDKGDYYTPNNQGDIEKGAAGYPKQNAKDDSARFSDMDGSGLVMSVVRSRANDDNGSKPKETTSPGTESSPPRPAVEALPGAFAAAFGGAYEQRRKGTLGTSSAENSVASSTRSLDDTGNSSGLDLSDESKKEEEAHGRPSAAGVSHKWKRYFIALAIAAALLVLFLGIFIGVAIPLLVGSLGDDPSEDMAVVEEGEEVSESPTWLVPNMTNATLWALEDPFSIQWLAYDWISRDPNWDDYEDWRKQQRFALACIHRTFGESSSRGPSYYFNDCQWLQGTECSDSGKVTALKLQTQVTRNVVHQYIPPEVSYLSDLKTLDVWPTGKEGMYLEKMFPLETLRAFPPVTKLDMSATYLEGSIPTTLGLLTSLTSLDATGNRLSSVIPSELGLLSSLNSLDLSSNDLSGSIPEEIGDLSSLDTFLVHENPNLVADLPLEFCAPDRTPVDNLQTDWCLDAECC